MRSFSRAIPSACVAAIMFGAQVGPSDAELNLCKWPKLFWFGVPDHCLAGISSETFYLVAATAFILTAIWALWPFAYSFVFQSPNSLPASGGQTQRREPEPALPITNTQSIKAPLTIERDVWLSDAIWRAYLGIWHIPPGEGLQELNVSESEKRRFAMLVIRDFRQIASEGTLPIWGWKGTSTLWEKVPNEFWKNNHIEYIQVATNGPQDEIKAQAENPYEQDTSKDWHHFMTSKAVIEQLYPSPQ